MRSCSTVFIVLFLCLQTTTHATYSDSYSNKQEEILDQDTSNVLEKAELVEEPIHEEIEQKATEIKESATDIIPLMFLGLYTVGTMVSVFIKDK